MADRERRSAALWRVSCEAAGLAPNTARTKPAQPTAFAVILNGGLQSTVDPDDIRSLVESALCTFSTRISDEDRMSGARNVAVHLLFDNRFPLCGVVVAEPLTTALSQLIALWSSSDAGGAPIPKPSHGSPVGFRPPALVVEGVTADTLRALFPRYSSLPEFKKQTSSGGTEKGVVSSGRPMLDVLRFPWEAEALFCRRTDVADTLGPAAGPTAVRVWRDDWKLFAPHGWLTGLFVVPEFTTKGEEATLVAWLRGTENATPGETIGAPAWHRERRGRERRMMHMGRTFDCAGNCADSPAAPVSPLHPIVATVRARLAALCSDALLPQTTANVDAEVAFDQITVNEYPPGAGIPAHVDAHAAFGAAIASLSLHSSAVMEFVLPAAARDACDVAGEASKQCVSILLPARSMLVLTGAARFAVTHEIPARKYDVLGTDAVLARDWRWSVTFRSVKSDGPSCVDCPAPHMCDARGGGTFVSRAQRRQ